MCETIYTLGHSTRSINEFINILKSYKISLLIDVRHYPGSKFCPQFNKTRLKHSLQKKNIDYVHILELGGRRAAVKTMKLNLGWRSLQFRGYADYMQSKEFKQAIKTLMNLTKDYNVRSCARKPCPGVVIDH